MTKTITHKTAPFQICIDTAALLNKTYPELSEMLGYNKTTFYQWRVNGKMPLVAANLCIAMQEQTESKLLANKKVFIVRTSTAEQEAGLVVVLKAMNMPWKEVSV